MGIVDKFIKNLHVEPSIPKEKIAEDLKKILKQADCKKDFECLKSGIKNLCEAKDIGLENYIECDPESCKTEGPAFCESGIPFGYSHMCKCPLRIYFCRKLKR